MDGQDDRAFSGFAVSRAAFKNALSIVARQVMV
jgi:hypothetical protein